MESFFILQVGENIQRLKNGFGQERESARALEF
jgi:hypothetical protein